MNDGLKVSVPSNRVGQYEISKFTISEKDARRFNINCHGRAVESGEYTQLLRHSKNNNHSTIVMSDTPSEVRDHFWFISGSKGHVVIAGLGIGMVANAVAHREKVKSVTVIEISQEVIQLTDSWLQKQSDKILIIEADIFKWNPKDRMKELNIDKFNCVWFDIWDVACADFLEGKTKLNRRWGRWAKEKSNWLEIVLSSIR